MDEENVENVSANFFDENDPGWQPGSDEYGPHSMQPDVSEDDRGLLVSLYALECEGFKPVDAKAPVPPVPVARRVEQRSFTPVVPSRQLPLTTAMPPSRTSVNTVPTAPSFRRVAIPVVARASPRLIPASSPATATIAAKPHATFLASQAPMPVSRVAPTPPARVVRPATPRLSLEDRIAQVKGHANSLPPTMQEHDSIERTKPLIDGGVPAPEKYPSPQDWPDNAIPPGSNFSQADWQAARIDEKGMQWDVIEIQNDQTSWLNCLPKPSLVMRQTIEAGKVKRTLVSVYSSKVTDPEVVSMLTQVFSDCLLVSKNSKPKFVGATEGQCIMGHTEYRVIRPRRDYLEPDRAFRVGAKISLSIDRQQKSSESDMLPELLSSANTH